MLHQPYTSEHGGGVPHILVLVLLLVWTAHAVDEGSSMEDAPTPFSQQENSPWMLQRGRQRAAASWARTAGETMRSMLNGLQEMVAYTTTSHDDLQWEETDPTKVAHTQHLADHVKRFAAPAAVGLQPSRTQLQQARPNRDNVQRSRVATGLPHGAASAPPQRRHFAAQATTSVQTARDVVYTTASQIVSILSPETTTDFCHDGFVGVELSTSTKFVCVDTNGVNTTRDALYVRSAARDVRANCSYIEGTSPLGVQCLCSSDYLLFRTRPTFFGCLPRNVSCHTRFMDLSSCRLPAYAEPEPDMDHCYSLSRSPTGPHGNGNASKGAWRLSMDCSIEAYINPSIYDALGAVPTTPENTTAVWLPTGIAVDNENGEQPTGTFGELSVERNLFPTAFDLLVARQNASLAHASTSNTSAMLHLTIRHPLVTYGTLELQFFDFNEPSRTDGGARVVVPLVVDNATGPSGMSAATFTDPVSGNIVAALGVVASAGRLWNLTFNISTLPDHYFFGGRLYMEAGLLSPFGLVSRYSVSGLEIEILDTPHPGAMRSYPKKLDTGTVALIAVGVSCVVFLVLVVSWKIWRRPPQDDVSVVGGRIHRATSVSVMRSKKTN